VARAAISTFYRDYEDDHTQPTRQRYCGGTKKRRGKKKKKKKKHERIHNRQPYMNTELSIPHLDPGTAFVSRRRRRC